MSLPRQRDTDVAALCMDTPGQGIMISAARQIGEILLLTRQHPD